MNKEEYLASLESVTATFERDLFLYKNLSVSLLKTIEHYLLLLEQGLDYRFLENGMYMETQKMILSLYHMKEKLSKFIDYCGFDIKKS